MFQYRGVYHEDLHSFPTRRSSDLVSRAEDRRHRGGSRGAPVRQLCRRRGRRSEEHTSELQSRLQLVCRLLLEKTKGRKPVSASGSNTLRRSTSDLERIGFGKFGPASPSSNCKPMASAGIKMSENTMTASTPSLRKGWMETSTASCGVLHTSRNACFARISRYSGRYRPAWRIIQTGTRGRTSPRQARRNSSLRLMGAGCRVMVCQRKQG